MQIKPCGTSVWSISSAFTVGWCVGDVYVRVVRLWRLVEDSVFVTFTLRMVSSGRLRFGHLRWRWCVWDDDVGGGGGGSGGGGGGGGAGGIMFLRQDGVLTMEIVCPRQLRSVVGVGVGEVYMAYLCQTGILPLKITRFKRLRWGLCVWDFYGGDCAWDVYDGDCVLGRLRWGLCVGTFTVGIVRCALERLRWGLCVRTFTVGLCVWGVYGGRRRWVWSLHRPS